MIKGNMKKRVKEVREKIEERKNNENIQSFFLEQTEPSDKEIELWIRKCDEFRSQPVKVLEHIYSRYAIIKNAKFDKYYQTLLIVETEPSSISRISIPQSLVFNVKNPISKKSFDEFCLITGFSPKTGKGTEPLIGKKIKIETIIYKWWLDEIIGTSVIATMTYFYNRDGWRINPQGIADYDLDYVEPMFQHHQTPLEEYFSDEEIKIAKKKFLEKPKRPKNPKKNPRSKE